MSMNLKYERGNPMSMNLLCNHLELWQTPTFITNMCRLHDDPVWSLMAYRHWVVSQLDGVWENREKEYENLERCIKDHCTELDEIIENPPKDLEVYEG